ncbi:hypothetical protein, partial [Enterobacter hormaechei]|uniref:hypothetical protein n=1 Tax=Enterobacter hormaechei TaxID=158836 RepID=UPI000A41D7F2
SLAENMRPEIWCVWIRVTCSMRIPSAWGQRAPGLYSPTYGAPGLYTYKGRGRTFGLNYSVLF